MRRAGRRDRTSDPAANTDAAIYVAHGITTHAQESEIDRFAVVDDLSSGNESGAAGLFDAELTSGLFYGYSVIDINGLVDNLGDRDLAARVVEHLLHLIPTVSPGAKKGSTAPFAYADMMLVEAGSRQPRSLAGAFRTPVSLKSPDLLTASLNAFGAHMRGFDSAYGAAEDRAMLCTADVELPGCSGRRTLDDLARWAANAVRAGGGGFHE